MKTNIQRRLIKAGYKITSAKEFLDLTNEEMTIIEIKINLIKKLRAVRRAAGVTQKQLAKLMNSSQSRVAMLESSSSDASLELIYRALLVLGVPPKEIAKTFSLLT